MTLTSRTFVENTTSCSFEPSIAHDDCLHRSAQGSDAALTPEGHGVRYDSKGEVIGVTIINARRIVERDGYLTITLPHSVRVDAGQLAALA